jgi:hypothetical protein
MSETRTAAQLYAEARQAQRIAEELVHQAVTAAQAEHEARQPKMPEVTADQPVFLSFAKYTGGRSYNYAAVGWKQGGQHVRWAVTGTETRRFNWLGLLQFIGEANWHTLVHRDGGKGIGPTAPAEEVPVAERIGSYGRVTGTDKLGPSATECSEPIVVRRWP